MAKRDKLTVRLHLDRELFLAPLRDLFQLLRMPDEPLPSASPPPRSPRPVRVTEPDEVGDELARAGERPSLAATVPPGGEGESTTAEPDQPSDPYERITDRAAMLELD